MQDTPLKHRRHHQHEDPENPFSPAPNDKPMKPTTDQPRLLHPSLHNIPQALRFPMAGFINTMGFIISLSIGNKLLDGKFNASTIYSISSILYLPIGHAVTSLIVFGWPKPYLKNLLMNMPIGITGTGVGSFFTGLLVNYEFDLKVAGFLSTLKLVTLELEEEIGQSYTNAAVVVITGIWGYVLSVMVNSKPKASGTTHKKEL